MVAAPHVERLPWWLVGLVVTLAAWRVYLGHASLPLPGRWLLILVVIGATAGRLFQLPHHLRPRRRRGAAGGDARAEAAGDADAARRDAAHLPRLLPRHHEFPVLADHPDRALHARLHLGDHRHHGRAALRAPRAAAPPRSLRTAGILLAQSTPLMLVLFLLFPRVTGPLWGLPQDAQAGATGLSDTMTPGQPQQPDPVGRGGVSREVRRATSRCPSSSTGAAR